MSKKLFLLFLIIALPLLSVFALRPNWEFGGQVDGFAYYLPLRSLAFDKDLDFTKENTFYEKRYGLKPYAWEQDTKTKSFNFPYSLGPSILWAPGVLLLKTTSPIDNLFSRSELLTLVFMSLGYGLATLILCQKLLAHINDKLKTYDSFVLLSLFFATPLYFYFLYLPLMSHVLSAFSTSLFVYFWFRSFGSSNTLRPVLLGTLLGIISLVRWQDVIFVAFPLIEGLYILVYKKSRWSPLRDVLTVLNFVLGFFLTFFPQMLFWKLFYGSFLSIPQGTAFFTELNRYLFEFLFSFRHGLFTWSPILLLSVAGITVGCHTVFLGNSRKNPIQKVTCLACLVILISATTINSSLVDWHGSDSFGARRIVSLFPVFVISTNYLTNAVIGIRKHLISLFFVATVVYNLVFAHHYALWTWDHFSKIYPFDIINAIFTK